MYEQKISGYSDSQLEDLFDELVSKWEERSMFVERYNKTIDVTDFCKTQMGIKNSYYFILGMRSAAKIVLGSVKEIEKKNLFERYGYKHKIIKDTEGNQPRVEVTVFRK